MVLFLSLWVLWILRFLWVFWVLSSSLPASDSFRRCWRRKSAFESRILSASASRLCSFQRPRNGQAERGKAKSWRSADGKLAPLVNLGGSWHEKLTLLIVRFSLPSSAYAQFRATELLFWVAGPGALQVPLRALVPPLLALGGTTYIYIYIYIYSIYIYI